LKPLGVLAANRGVGPLAHSIDFPQSTNGDLDMSRVVALKLV